MSTAEKTALSNTTFLRAGRVRNESRPDCGRAGQGRKYRQIAAYAYYAKIVRARGIGRVRDRYFYSGRAGRRFNERMHRYGNANRRCLWQRKRYMSLPCFIGRQIRRTVFICVLRDTKRLLGKQRRRTAPRTFRVRCVARKRSHRARKAADADRDNGCCYHGFNDGKAPLIRLAHTGDSARLPAFACLQRRGKTDNRKKGRAAPRPSPW